VYKTHAAFFVGESLVDVDISALLLRDTKQKKPLARKRPWLQRTNKNTADVADPDGKDIGEHTDTARASVRQSV
jgi:hypothetical protein